MMKTSIIYEIFLALIAWFCIGCWGAIALYALSLIIGGVLFGLILLSFMAWFFCGIVIILYYGERLYNSKEQE